LQADKLGQQIFAPDSAAAAGQTHLGPEQRSVLPTVPSLKDTSADACYTAAAACIGPSSLPPLHEDTYVDKDTLSRLFLVSSKVAEEVKVSGWQLGAALEGLWLHGVPRIGCRMKAV
jgi:hypothetical protein